MRSSGLVLLGAWSLMGAACGRPNAAATPEATGSPLAAVASARPPAPTEPSPKDACLAAARACGRHVLSDDYQGVVACMPDEAVKLLGGRNAIVDLMRQANAEMARDGVRFEESLVDPPTELAQAENRTFAILPQVVVMRVPDGHLHQRSFLLAVSSDRGHTWKFVDGVKLDRSMVEQLFPDFPPSLTLPRVGRPELVTSD